MFERFAHMVSSARESIACVLLILSTAVASCAQTTPEKDSNASISGKITLKNKGLPGVVVVAEEQNPKVLTSANHRGTTDQNGSYRITNLPSGTYVINPVAPALAREDEPNNSIAINEGESVEDIDFSFVPGGVITGKITDADGKPLIEEPVIVLPINATYVDGRLFGSIRTDDRGIYRAFGLRKGKYKVWVGQVESLPRGPQPTYRQTFYPSVTEDAKATLIEVTEGSEITNVDIIVGRPITTFRASGRILDVETGKPLPNIKYGVYQSRGDYGGSSVVGRTVTSANGEFSLENVLPGKYVVFIVPEDSGVRGDSVSFEVVDRDVTDLVIKAGKAATVSGIVVFEGANETKLNGLFIQAWVNNNEPHFSGSFPRPINPDGSFRIGDLRKGPVRFRVTTRMGRDVKPIEVVRVDRDGVAQPNLILKDGEQVSGVRLVLRYLTGAIHGQIKVEGDELLPNSRLSIWVDLIDPVHAGNDYTGSPSPQLDSRKRFALEGLAAGTYEVNVAVYESGRQDTNRIYKQQVTVTDNAVSEVTITIKTKP